MLTVPLPWHANGTANVRLERLSAIDPLLSRPGPVAPEGIAAAVPGATNAGAVPGGTGRSAPLPGGGPGGPGGAWADAAAGAASSARAAQDGSLEEQFGLLDSVDVIAACSSRR